MTKFLQCCQTDIFSLKLFISNQCKYSHFRNVFFTKIFTVLTYFQKLLININTIFSTFEFIVPLNDISAS